MYTSPIVRLPSFELRAGALSDFSRISAPFGRSFCVIGGNRAMEQGLPRLKKALGPDQILLGAFPYGGQCTLEKARHLAESLPPCDFLVGMGGGKCIDTAKLCAHLLGRPLLSLPTLISNCAPITALSVLYHEDGSFDRFEFYDAPPAFTLIDLSLCLTAPLSYFRAGMGDAMAKYPESTFSARGDRLGQALDHMSLMGVTLSRTCWEPILSFGQQAASDYSEGRASTAVEICARSIILSAGLVSLLAHDNYNCSLAHSVCYGLQLLPGVENRFLHGDLVAYGMLILLLVDGSEEEARRLRSFLVSIGMKVTLREMGIPLDPDYLAPALHEAVTGPDMAHIPYSITEDMVFSAMQLAEQL